MTSSPEFLALATAIGPSCAAMDSSDRPLFIANVDRGVWNVWNVSKKWAAESPSSDARAQLTSCGHWHMQSVQAAASIACSPRKHAIRKTVLRCLNAIRGRRRTRRPSQTHSQADPR